MLQCCIATGCNEVKNNGVRCKTGTNYSSHGSHAITHFFPRFAATSYIHFNFWFVHLHICIQCLIRTHAPTCFNNEAWESHWSTQTVIERVNHTSFAGFETLHSILWNLLQYSWALARVTTFCFWLFAKMSPKKIRFLRESSRAEMDQKIDPPNLSHRVIL